MSCGSLGAIIANPIDVVKIRMMATPHSYSTVRSALLHIYNFEGSQGLYKGLVPSTLRSASIVAAGELAAYDIIKTALRKHFQRDDIYIHIVSSLCTGVVAAIVAAPFDLLKARAMNNESQSTLRCIVMKAYREEGILVFFRGVMPAYLRLGPHALLCFPIFEQLRRFLGLSYV
jgi:hypothetical protein